MFGFKHEVVMASDGDEHPAATGNDGRLPTVDDLLWAPGGRRWIYELILWGALDLVGAWRLEAILREVIASGARDIHLDLAGVSFIDSTGLDLLMKARSQLSDLDGRLVLRAPSPAVLRLVFVADLCLVLGLNAQPSHCRHYDDDAQERRNSRYPAGASIEADEPLRITGVHVIGVYPAERISAGFQHRTDAAADTREPMRPVPTWTRSTDHEQ